MKSAIVIFSLLLSGFAYAGHHASGEMSQNLATVKAGYAAFNAGDIPAWRATLTEDSEWVMQQGMPFAGTWVGAQAIEENVFATVAALWTNFKVEPIAYYESDDKVFIHVRMTADGLDTEVMHMATMEDGKFAQFQVFENTAMMLAAAKQ